MTLVAVPEASVHKNYGLELWEDKIGTSYKITTVQPVSETKCVEPLTNKHLGLSVLASCAAHIEPPLRPRQNIYHN